MDEFDVLIRGDGPVGCTLALALGGSGLRTALAQRSPPEGTSAFRPIALSYASRLILERVGVWTALSPTPINTIHVSQQRGFGRACFDALECGVPALGYVVEYSALANALRAAVDALAIPRAFADSPARCVVHAEGTAADAREKRYDQHALVANIRVRPVAANTAYERFTPEGPLALLPYAGEYALVWSTDPGRAEWLAAVPESEFVVALQEHMGSKPGWVEGVGERSVHPLALRVRATRIEPRVAYIGNAAQTLHPVAGQGLNLGLRDAWELSRVWRTAGDPGEAAVLERYARRRRVDAGATIRMTDTLAGVFLGEGRFLRAARGAGLTALDIAPWARRFFARRMIFGASALP